MGSQNSSQIRDSKVRLVGTRNEEGMNILLDA